MKTIQRLVFAVVLFFLAFVPADTAYAVGEMPKDILVACVSASGQETASGEEADEDKITLWDIIDYALLPVVEIVLAVIALSMRRRFDKSRIEGVRFNGNPLIYIAFIAVMIGFVIAFGTDVLVFYIPAVVSLVCYSVIAFVPVEIGETQAIKEAEAARTKPEFDKEEASRNLKELMTMGMDTLNVLFNKLIGIFSEIRRSEYEVVTVDAATRNEIHREKHLDPIPVISALVPVFLVLGAVLFAVFMLGQLVILVVSLIPIIEFVRNYRKWRAAIGSIR